MSAITICDHCGGRLIGVQPAWTYQIADDPHVFDVCEACMPRPFRRPKPNGYVAAVLAWAAELISKGATT